MHLPLFKALKTINIDDSRATEVVESLEEHMAMQMQDATRGLEVKFEGMEAKLESTRSGLEAKMDALRTQMTMVGTMLGVIGLAIAASPIIAALIK